MRGCKLRSGVNLARGVKAEGCKTNGHEARHVCTSVGKGRVFPVHALVAYQREWRIELHSFFTLVLDGGECSA
jgi:hypothetical protein